MLDNTGFSAACIDPPLGPLMHAARSGAPRNRHGRSRKPTEGARKCGVLDLFVNDPAEVWPLTHGPSAKFALPPVLGVSSRSQPARTAMRRPGPPRTVGEPRPPAPAPPPP